jgi:hypothetical protein
MLKLGGHLLIKVSKGELWRRAMLLLTIVACS